MTPQEITTLFNQEINKTHFASTANIDRRNVYKLRNSPTIKIGTMLQVLFEIGAIEIKKK